MECCIKALLLLMIYFKLKVAIFGCMRVLEWKLCVLMEWARSFLLGDRGWQGVRRCQKKKNRPRQDINQISLEATRHAQVQYTEFSEVCLHFICLPPGLCLQYLFGLEA